MYSHFLIFLPGHWGIPSATTTIEIFDGIGVWRREIPEDMRLRLK